MIAPVVFEVVAVVSLLVIFGSVNVLEAYVIVDGDCIAPVVLPSNTALDVKVICPVPPFATSKAVPDNPIARVPEVVTGDPVILRKLGTDAATLVTVPDAVVHVIAVPTPPCDVNTCPAVPAVVGKLKLYVPATACGKILTVPEVDPFKSTPAVDEFPDISVVVPTKFPVMVTGLFILYVDI
jgi:hypothetical protein